MENPKPTLTRKFIIIGGVILVIVCICACLIILISAGLIWFARENVPPTNSVQPTQTIDQQMDEIQQQVTQLRWLQAAIPITRTLLSPEQLRLNVTEDFLEDYSAEDAREDALILSAFGL